MELSLEQQFELAKIQQAAENADREELIKLIVSAYKLVMLKDNAIKGMLRPAAFG